MTSGLLATRHSPLATMLRVENLTKHYGALHVLEGVGFSLGPGDRLGLVGRNGTGKSTVLRLVAGLEEPDGGLISLLPGYTLAYLPQSTAPEPGRTVHDEALGGDSFGGSSLPEQLARVRAVTALLAEEDDPNLRMMAKLYADRLSSKLVIGGRSPDDLRQLERVVEEYPGTESAVQAGRPSGTSKPRPLSNGVLGPRHRPP